MVNLRKVEAGDATETTPEQWAQSASDADFIDWLLSDLKTVMEKIRDGLTRANMTKRERAIYHEARHVLLRHHEAMTARKAIFAEDKT